jgi:transposase
MPAYKNQKKTRQYTNEFKAKAVKLTHLSGASVKGVAEALDIHPFMLSRWRKEYREGKIVADKRKMVSKKPKALSENDRIRKLEKQVADLKEENDLLKKWQRFLAEERKKGSGSWRSIVSSSVCAACAGF